MPRLSALLTMACLLAACPAPSPSSTTARRDPATPPPAEPAAPGSDPTPLAAPPMADSPVAEPALATLPPALAAKGVRPVVRSLWRALEAVDAGDAAAMAPLMTDDGRWLPPGRPEEAVGKADLQRAMGPWSGGEIDLDVRRIIDPGAGAFAVQVTVANREGAELRHELVLLVEPRGELVAAVHHFGDPLGPVRLGTSKVEPLALGPVGEPTLEGGAAVTAAIEAAKELAAAVDAHQDDAVRAHLREDVVLHDVIARHTRHGREGWLAGMRETLGPTGRLVVDQHLESSRVIVLEGAVYGREGDPKAAAAPQEHGFVDVHRIVDGAIAETWHYVNRRGRPFRPRLRP